ncbi:MAG: hypothetical protein L0387_36615, partial [Acidobacteria bacterium]|nr:hypothetical protein [Acidobacteriota bacterium]
IQWLSDLSLSWAEAMWRAVWPGTLLILVAWAFSMFANKLLPAALRCWLWRIVFLKFALALVWVTPIPVPVLPPQSAPFSEEVQLALAAPGIEARPASAVPYGRAEMIRLDEKPPRHKGTETGRIESRLCASVSLWFTQNVAPLMPDHIGRDRTVETANLTEGPASRFKPERLQITSWLLLLWSVGFFACSFGFARHWHQANRLRWNARPSENGSLNRSGWSLARELGCGRAPLLLFSKEIHSPVVLGIWNPAILIPATLEESEPSQQSRMMLAHELAHVRRHDLIWLWLLTFVRAVFFFNPLIWLAGREARLAQEIACDELAVRCLQARPSEYAMMLVDVAAGKELPSATPLVVGVAESYQTMKRRLKAMKYVHSQSTKQLASAAVLIAVLGAGVIVPWQLVAQNPPAPVSVQPPPGDVLAPPSATTPALALSDDEIDASTPPAKPAIAKRKRASVKFAPAAPAAVIEDEPFSEDVELPIRPGKALSVEVVPNRVPYPHVREVRSKAGTLQESNESRDQVLRYKLIFKSGLARLRHLLSQPTPDDTDVETAFNLVGKLERQLLELSEQTENRDLKSTGNVIREQLTELNAAVDAAKAEKTSQTRAKRLTRANAIVEGLTELVPDIDAIGGKLTQNLAVQPRNAASYGSGYGGGYGSGSSAVAR